MSSRPNLAWIAPPLLAALGLPLLVGLVSGAAAPPAEPRTELAWANPRPPTACSPEIGPDPTGQRLQGEPARLTVGRPAPTAAGPAAWRLSPVLDAGGALAGWHLVASAPQRGPTSVELPPAASVRGPTGGWLAVAQDDGHASSIVLVSATDGCSRVAFHDDRVIRQAVVEPTSGTILFHALARANRADLGVWRLRPGKSQPEQLLPPLAPGDPILAEIGTVWTTALVLSADDGSLAIQSCGEATCRTRIVDLASGIVRRPPGPEEGELIGLDAARSVGFRACAGFPCPLVATDLSSGEQREIATAAMSASTATVGDRFLALTTENVAGGHRLTAIDVGSGRHWELGHPGANLSLLPRGGGAAAGIEPGRSGLPALDLGSGAPLTLDIDPLAAEPKEATR